MEKKTVQGVIAKLFIIIIIATFLVYLLWDNVSDAIAFSLSTTKSQVITYGPTETPAVTEKYTNIDETFSKVYSDGSVYRASRRIHDKNYLNKLGKPCIKRLPSCIIIGVYKCGTRELIDFMAMHPNIVIRGHPYSYELPFFKDKNYQLNNFGELKKQMPCSFSDQITVFKHPGYFESSLVPERLYKYNANLKMILLVREPVTRLISHISFVKRMTENSTMSYLQRMVVINEKTEKVYDNIFVRYSIYDEPLMRYLKYFSMDHLLIIETTELQTDPVSVLGKVEQFLQIPKFISHHHFVFNAEKNFYCVKMSKRATCYGKTRGRSFHNYTASKTISILRNFYRPHNLHFFELINRTFEW